MAGLFADKVAFITGASSGIGAAAAKEFAAQGALVALGARRTERLRQLQREISDAGGTALALGCDVTDRDSINQAVTHAVEVFGKVDVVLANAGFGVSGNVAKLETEDFRRQFDTNVFGVLDTYYACREQLEKQRGRFGIVASVAGKLATPGTAAYCASKFALAGLAECMYHDLRGRGVSVTCINPGFVASEIRSVNNRGEYTGKPDSVPGWLVMSASKAARQIVRAMYRRRPEVTITGHGKALVFVGRHFPRTTRLLLGMAAGK